MSVVNLNPSSYKLKPLETIVRLVKAPNFLANPSGEFAQLIMDNLIRASASNSSIWGEATLVISQAHM